MGVGNKKGRTATLQNDPQQIVSDFNADLFYLDVDDYDPATDALYDIEDMDYLSKLRSKNVADLKAIWMKTSAKPFPIDDNFWATLRQPYYRRP